MLLSVAMMLCAAVLMFRSGPQPQTLKPKHRKIIFSIVPTLKFIGIYIIIKIIYQILVALKLTKLLVV